MYYLDTKLGGYSRSRNLFLLASGLIVLSLVFLPSTPAQAALGAFVLVTAVWLKLLSRRLLDGIRVTREHPGQVFEGDGVQVSLRVERGEGYPVQLLELEDQFMAGLTIGQHQLVPLLSRQWRVSFHYRQSADRHRGVYFIGPVQLRVADPLGVFFCQRDLPSLSRLIIYPHPHPLPDYQIPGPQPPTGPSLDTRAQVGQGEEILGVREYRHGDPPSRVHWRTSARRRQLHVVQLNRPLQTELAVMLDLTRRARFGLGAESTTEIAIHTATSILSRGFLAHHRISLACAHRDPVTFPARSGLAHLHLLLDHLAMVAPAGEMDFWGFCAPRALMLKPGSRLVLILTSGLVQVETALDLIRRLVITEVAVDIVLIDERPFIKIYSDQETNRKEKGLDYANLTRQLRMAGARVFPLDRTQSVFDDQRVVCDGQHLGRR